MEAAALSDQGAQDDGELSVKLRSGGLPITFRKRAERIV
jgi:hypothetical protein